MSEIKPALTAEQWKTAEARDWTVYATTGERLEYLARPTVPVLGRHKVAALALYNQPFGFTREDARLVRDAAERMGFDYAHLKNLADRIEALLPPDL